jgi:hypothetical protein
MLVTIKVFLLKYNYLGHSNLINVCLLLENILDFKIRHEL